MGSEKADYENLIERLRNHGSCFMYGADFSDTCVEAANAIETLLTERNTLHAHVVTNWLGSCYCSNCKGNIDYTSSYCNWCGAKLDEPEEREQNGGKQWN